jgi:hypothetical protein
VDQLCGAAADDPLDKLALILMPPRNAKFAINKRSFAMIACAD